MYEKNLQFIDNEALKTRLSKISIDDSRMNMSYCMTPTNDYLLMKNDVPMDDINNPRGAIKEMLASTIKQQMGTNDIIITFGIGLCYMLDEVFNTYPSKIFVYEPDIQLLHFVLNNVDISEHLSSGRVFITDNLNELLAKLSATYITKDKVEVVYLKNYAVVKSQELLELTQKVYETCKSKTVDVNTITRYSKTWMFNSLKNIITINNGQAYMLSDLEGKFESQTALILAAGPSFADNIEKIKANREKYVIFAVNKVAKLAIANGIIPDFIVGLDASYIEDTISGFDDVLERISYITDLRSDPRAYLKPFKKIFISFAENDILAKKLKNYNSQIKMYECGGSSTTMAFVSAVKMGFSKIVFSGLDLAFKNSTIYSSGEQIERISEDKIKIYGIEKNLSFVKSVTGEKVLTSDDYAAFIKHFETLIKDMEYTEVYNTTSFGAAIEGMKNSPFENIFFMHTANTTAFILGEVKPFKLETSAWTQDELALVNEVIALLSKGAYSPALISAITKSPLLYQYMQADILKVIQSKMNPAFAEEFMNQAKQGIKEIIDVLQKNRLI